MFNKLQKAIQHSDMFGHPVQINYKNHHQTHVTLIGGYCSMVVRVTLALLVFFKFQTMFLKQSNTIISYRSASNVDIPREYN